MAELKVKDTKKDKHIRIRMDVLGAEGWDVEMNYKFTDLKTVKLVQGAIAQALLGLN